MYEFPKGLITIRKKKEETYELCLKYIDGDRYVLYVVMALKKVTFSLRSKYSRFLQNFVVCLYIN